LRIAPVERVAAFTDFDDAVLQNVEVRMDEPGQAATGASRDEGSSGGNGR
jgi:hypothetical protein